MSGKPLYTYLEPEILADRITGRTPANTKFAVLDVRDEDEWAEGRISVATHLPTILWTERTFVQETMLKYLDHDEVILHCYKSQQRGPSCARLLAIAYEQYQEQQQQQTEGGGGAVVKVPDVRVLRGGFCDFERKFKDHADLVHK